LNADAQALAPGGWTSIVSQYRTLGKTEFFEAGLPMKIAIDKLPQP